MSDWFLERKLMGCRRVFIRDFDVSAAIGVLPNEQNRRQSVRINVDFWVRVSDTPSSRDALRDVVDYDIIRQGIMRIVSAGHIGLLETLADQTLLWVLSQSKIVAARVRAEKSEVYPDCRSAGVEVFGFNEGTHHVEPM